MVREFQPEPALSFDHDKAVQIIAHFLRKSGGEADKLKLIKLVYLAERLSLEKRGRTINFDDYFSLPHGPVASTALNGIDGKFDDQAWNSISLAKNRKRVSLMTDPGRDRLSNADVAILDAVWEQHGHRSASQIRNWTHRNCPEYVEVGVKARLPITVAEILEQVGDPAVAREGAIELRQLQVEMAALGRLGAA